MFSPALEREEIINNRRLMDIFHCACEGGIRYATKTDTIVLVVNNTKNGLPNIWEGDKLLFSGRLLKPREKILSGANKRLREFLQAGKDIFLFEVNEPGRYQYKGPVKFAGEMYISSTESGAEYPVFPLRIY